MARAVEDVLDAHLQNDIRMRADPRTLQSDLAQQRVERGARLTLVDGIDPDQDAVHREQLVADRVGKAFVVDRWAGLDAGSGQCLEDTDEAAVLRGRVPPCGGVAAPENRDRVTEMGLLIGVHARAPRRIVCRAELGRRSLTGACPRIIRVYDTSCAVFKTGDCVPQVPPILSLRT